MDLAYDPADPLDVFRAKARAWLEAHVPRVSDEAGLSIFAEHDDEERYLAEARRQQRLLYDAGWVGLAVPTEYGGRGLTPVHEIVWRQEAAAFDLHTDPFAIGIGMAVPTILTWGSEAQKLRWVPKLLTGEEIWCQLFSEPNAGSDVAAVQTRAVRDGDEWIVNGQKVWTSGAHYSDWGMLLARTDPDVPKHRGLTYFGLDMRQPAVQARPLRQMTGGANFNEVFLSDARVGADEVIGGEGNGWSVAVTTLMNERVSIGALGSLQGGGVFRSLERYIEALRARGPDPLEDRLIRERLTDVYARGRILDLTARRIVQKLREGEIPTAEGSIAKLFLTDLATRLTRLGVDMAGPYGLLAGEDALEEGRWTQAFLGAPGLRIAGGTDEIMRNLVGERVLGLPREPRVDKDVPFRELAQNRP